MGRPIYHNCWDNKVETEFTQGSMIYTNIYCSVCGRSIKSSARKMYEQRTYDNGESTGDAPEEDDEDEHRR